MKASIRLLSSVPRRTTSVTRHHSRPLSTDEIKDSRLNIPYQAVIEAGHQQFNLESPVDALRLALLHDVRPLLQYTDLRLSVNNSLGTSTSFPADPTPQPVEFPVDGQLLPHNLFRKVMSEQPYSKKHRRVLKQQFLRCQTPSEILRVVAVALQNKDTTRDLSRACDGIVYALYRSRDQVSDKRVLETINVIVLRFKLAGLPTPTNLLKIGIKFAARTRSLPAMKRYLKMHRDFGIPMSRHQFRAIIAKFSIGLNGHGEIRNGRWKRSDLLQVLLGFENTPAHDQHHLACFLQRNDWTLMFGWLAVLSRCKASDQIWHEYMLWKKSPDCLYPKQLPSTSKNLTTKVRGDYRFIESMAYSGDIRRAWIILKDTAFPYENCRQCTRFKLIQEIQHATVWHDKMQTDLLDLYTVELQKMEEALGVAWVSLGGDFGYHIPTQLPNETLKKLADPDFELETTYGYPYDLSPEEEKAQRGLTEAGLSDDMPLPFHDSKNLP